MFFFVSVWGAGRKSEGTITRLSRNPTFAQKNRTLSGGFLFIFLCLRTKRAPKNLRQTLVTGDMRVGLVKVLPKKGGKASEQVAGGRFLLKIEGGGGGVSEEEEAAGEHRCCEDVCKQEGGGTVFFFGAEIPTKLIFLQFIPV